MEEVMRMVPKVKTVEIDVAIAPVHINLLSSYFVPHNFDLMQTFLTSRPIFLERDIPLQELPVPSLFQSQSVALVQVSSNFWLYFLYEHSPLPLKPMVILPSICLTSLPASLSHSICGMQYLYSTSFLVIVAQANLSLHSFPSVQVSSYFLIPTHEPSLAFLPV